MAYDSRVYRILIASPSDVENEREVAVRVIQQWNDLYSYVRKVVLLPLRWETHTAPEYGTRPQEVINRAIVDECDMLVGVFWTRIGSPTGVADSGTLEEIERVGTAGKPVMLYFSRMGVDPEKIDGSQVERLRVFKSRSYPTGLIENYQNIVEFRDKFARQLELKVRDLQRADSSTSGAPPLSLSFLSAETGEAIGNIANVTYDHLTVSDLDTVPAEHRALVTDMAKTRIKNASYIPIALGVESHSSAGIRNLYVELDISSNVLSAELTDSIQPDYTRYLLDASASSWSGYLSSFIKAEQQIPSKMEKTFAKYQAGSLQRIEKGWRLAFEWEALQPQRLRLIKPFLFAYCPQSAAISIEAKVFSDSFAEPLKLRATLDVEAKQNAVVLARLIPDWNAAVSKVTEESGKKFAFR
jgi:hypothetical protein